MGVCSMGGGSVTHCFRDRTGSFEDIGTQIPRGGSENTRGADIRPCGLTGSSSTSSPSTVLSSPSPHTCLATPPSTAKALHLNCGSVCGFRQLWLIWVVLEGLCRPSHQEKKRPGAVNGYGRPRGLEFSSTVPRLPWASTQLRAPHCS